jgi:hypothetical protein
MSDFPSLFIANSKISLFLKKNLPLDHRKKFTCMMIKPKCIMQKQIKLNNIVMKITSLLYSVFICMYLSHFMTNLSSQYSEIFYMDVQIRKLTSDTE